MQKKRDILSEKRESGDGDGAKKREFTPESGNVDTYVLSSLQILTIFQLSFPRDLS